MSYGHTYDCVVVGSGHAGSCAALSFVDSLRSLSPDTLPRVLVIDKCPPEWAGGNGYFTAGAFRTTHAGITDLLPLVSNAPPSVAERIDMDPYSAEDFRGDIFRLSEGKSDAKLAAAVVDNSREAVGWLKDFVHVPFVFSFNRQAYEVDGRMKFWGGMVLAVEDGGKGLIAAHQRALEREGIETWFNTKATQVLLDVNGRVAGILVEREGAQTRIGTKVVILACGGFEASEEMRIRYLGPHWARAKVRGTPYNTGDGIVLATSIGAQLTGSFDTCHSTCWDFNAPSSHGSRLLSNQFTKSGYPLGLMVNAQGERFVDEGEDYRNYTYAKFGREILRQKEGYVFQIWDESMVRYLRAEEYGEDVVKKVWGQSIEDLASKLKDKGLENPEKLVETVNMYNDAARAFVEEHPEKKWDPATKDGLGTQSSRISLAIPKSNWALPLVQPPFLAVKVTCGITFTFGGIEIDPATAGVLRETDRKTIGGLYATGEIVGGLFSGNYPGGSGLTAGAVFGRKAGKNAAKTIISG